MLLPVVQDYHRHSTTLLHSSVPGWLYIILHVARSLDIILSKQGSESGKECECVSIRLTTSSIGVYINHGYVFTCIGIGHVNGDCFLRVCQLAHPACLLHLFTCNTHVRMV